MEEIKTKFSVIEDPRHEGYIKHKLSDILILVMGAVICGMTELADMMTYFKSKSEFYKETFQIDQIPSKPTMSRIFTLRLPESIKR